MPRKSKNAFTINGDLVTIYHPDWDFIATATIRDDYAEEIQSVTWSRNGDYLYNASRRITIFGHRSSRMRIGQAGD